MDNTPTEIAVLVRNRVVHDLSPAVGVGSLATSINDSGLICGWSWGNPKGWVYDSIAQRVIHWIDPLPGKSGSGAQVINAAGDVAGMSDSHAFLYSGTLKDLGPAAFVSGLNDAGIVSGSLGKPYPQNFSPAIWDANQPSPTATELPLPAGFTGGHGEGINNHGEVVGSCWNQATYNGIQSAFIYSQGASTDLNTLISDPSWHLEFAEEINDEGQIVGYGTHNGQRTAFIMSSRFRQSVPDLVGTLFGAAAEDGSGWLFVGGHPIPVDPWGPWVGMNVAKRDALIGLAIDEIAMYINDRGVREKVRTGLLEGVRTSLETLMTTTGESRTPPVGASRRPGTARKMHAGKDETSIRRFQFSGGFR